MKTKLLIAAFLLPLVASAQSYFDNLHKEIEAGVFVSTSGTIPFWLRNNQFGIVPTDAPGVTLRARISPNKARPIGGFQGYASLQDGEISKKRAFDNLQKPKRNFTFDYAVEVVANVGKTNQVLLPEMYGSVKWKGIELIAGRRREIYGLVDSTLSAGSYIWSGNALPVPKIQLSTPGYVRFGKSAVSFKAGISHGMVADNGVVQNFYIHQKWLYGQIGTPDGKLQVNFGLNHNVQWGGYSEILKNQTETPFELTIDGYLAPYPFYTYQFVLIPFLQKFKDTDPTKLPPYDRSLAIGNQLGSADIGFSYKFDNVDFQFYHQHPYDFARSIANLNNLQDGNNGFSFTFKQNILIKKILVEYLNTTSQGRYRFGQIRESNDGEVDDYFFHGQYQGWYYNDKVIGTPFIDLFTIDNAPFTNNRVRAFSFAGAGAINKIDYLFRYSFTKGLGTYINPINFKKHYFLVSVARQIQKSQQLRVNLAADLGSTATPNSLGTFVSYSYSF